MLYLLIDKDYAENFLSSIRKIFRFKLCDLKPITKSKKELYVKPKI